MNTRLWEVAVWLLSLQKLYDIVGITAVFVRPDLTKKIGAKLIADENLSEARN